MQGFALAGMPAGQDSITADQALLRARSRLLPSAGPSTGEHSFAALVPVPKGNRDALWFWAEDGSSCAPCGQG